jgi:hypothetical protein
LGTSSERNKKAAETVKTVKKRELMSGKHRRANFRGIQGRAKMRNDV